MSMKNEDLQSLESEKRNQGFRNGLPPPKAFLQHLCSGPCPLMLCLGFSLLLMIGMFVIGSKNARNQRDLETLRASLSNFTSNTVAEVQALHSLDGSLQEAVTSLKAVVENQGQELQAARSLNDKVFSLESKLEKEQQELQTGYSEMLLRVQQLVQDMNFLRFQMVHLKSNDSQSSHCLINWLEHEGSCYWFSFTEKPWPEAEMYCQREHAHLVVVDSWNEQKFLEQHISSVDTWIGLTLYHGLWTWVDGTDYETSFQNWSPGRPYHWLYHLLNVFNPCVHFMNDGRWIDNLCMQSFRWVCEIELNMTSY